MELINENKNLSENYNLINVNDDRTSNTLLNITNNSPPLGIEEKNEDTNNNININIYRYKFTNEFTDELFKFSKIHQYDHRTDFKEAWKEWTESQQELILSETERLNQLGYLI